MELFSSEREHLKHLIERLQLTSATLSRVAYDDRTLNMVKRDIDYIVGELEDIVDESWHLRDDDEGIVRSNQPLGWDSLPEIPEPEPECEHDKAYAGWILASNPPKTQWICRKCKKQGTDEGAYSSRDGEDYRLILQEVIDKTVKGEK